MDVTHREPPYARSAPSPQQTLDLFKGSWASRLPGQLSSCTAGTAALFEDPRVDWAASKLQELGIATAGSDVLELGPLEGGHSYRLLQRGARSVTAVEAHREAYLKCLIAKELLGYTGARFLFGDAVAFLRETEEQWDVGFVSGFLYHMVDPIDVIDLLCQRCRALFIWTVYYDAQFCTTHPGVPAGGGPVVEAERSGLTYRLHRHDYGDGFSYSQFWGGGAQHANWLEKDSIIEAVAHFGLSRQIVELEDNRNGAALRMVAAR